jgi:hypothetical protein
VQQSFVRKVAAGDRQQGDRRPHRLRHARGTLTDLEAIFAKARQRAAAYVGAFADATSDGFDFTVGFDPSVVADRQQAGKPIPAWTRPLEAVFYRYLFTPAASPAPEAEYSLQWTRARTTSTKPRGSRR